MALQVIVCVDDEKTVLRSLKAELQEAISNDYIIEIAEGGEEALELIMELLDDGYEVPLIISDHIMPEMNGDELLRRVHIISPKTLKIMLTGQADIEAVGNAIKNANLYRYIAKPWQQEDLSLTVKEAVNSYHQNKLLAEQNAQLQQMNSELAKLNFDQALLIAQLNENENRLTQFLEAMPIGVGVLDAEGKVYYINHKAKEIFGKGVVPDINSEQLSEVYQTYRAGTDREYPPEDLPVVRALRGENAAADDVEVHNGDKIIPLEISATPIYDRTGKITYAINTILDITDRKKAEAERKNLITELFQVNSNLELALDTEVKITEATSRFVPNQFLSFLGYDSIVDVKLGDAVELEMSILFSDIRDFTTISEQMTPQDNFKFINSYLSYMEPLIVENHGFIDKYIGDAIMALFSEGADNAVKAGIEMLHTLAEYNQYRVSMGDVPIQIGVGINTGSLMLGTVGGRNRMDGTVIGDAVNLAARIESLTKNYEVPLLITQQTVDGLRNPADYGIRVIDKVQVKGKSAWVTVYEVFDADLPFVKAGKLATLPVFTEALSLYNIYNFTEAAGLFADCLRQNPGDRVARIYLARCQ
ncbi:MULTISPECIES: adenylate/guanylate cyclase domain-containing protein [unclassified Microcoleus]|jgi:adenylate cyclase|uniref:adenylate/guanylate cyclase domain-containing protein n=1 Tax=unclassified Microcoleus TaxID=2642155 RepID=UPI001DAF95A5|nr:MULTISPECIES: adenylate/guanylate cyclase domain-containing protein [unclassified Microcoleus]MCC3420601.1 response regulator [Microcoleus sp. PH2017_07_MST_O_A]MCC3429906.1 response regulator [Microcoleus sp. PH2017_04_SCI_O_A]MCC3441481.1 response regulator [Microcoleus sp. PH2017_03_ELD_O_A]MCC3466311.1 response regulator [Microcoleus sp. PH2017_06_SFM_O_A]MCC3502075.1 response regulator [Microcoleus sp. PH2017_19_SFW_U_A]MCC3508715.1 response regulator [Microcoleus sp. PH2017_17_BER_D_